MSVTIQDILLQKKSVENTPEKHRDNYSYSMFRGIPLDTENITAGTEAINFMPDSKLGTELVAALQKMMDYRDEVIEERLSMYPDITRQMLMARTYDLVAKKTHNELFPAFRSIVKKHTGIDLKTIVDINQKFKVDTPQFMFAIDISFNGTLTTIEHVITKVLGSSVPVKRFKKYEDVYNEIMKTWDPSTTNLSAPRSKVIQEVFKKLDFATTMYFDPITAFFASFFSPKQHRIEPFTAREIAGIVIHEIGHVHTLIERIADDFYRKKYTDIVLTEYVASKATIPAKLDMIEEIAEVNKKYKVLDKLDQPEFKTEKKLAELSMKLAGVISKRKEFLLKNIGEDTSSGGLETTLDFLYFIFNILAFMLVWTSVVPIMLFIRIVMEIVTLSNIKRIAKDRTDRKHGDTRYSARNEFALETWADEFSVRLGFGGDLNSAFNKMDTLSRSTAAGYYTSGMRDSWLYYVMGKFSYIAQTVMMTMDEHSYLGHENTPDRTKTIERMILEFFKQHRGDVDPKIMDHMITDFEKAVAYRKKVNNPGVFYKAIEVLGQVFYHITAPTIVFSRLYKILSKSHYYKDLQKSILVIENNKMFYHRAKLEQIARDRQA